MGRLKFCSEECKHLGSPALDPPQRLKDIGFFGECGMLVRQFFQAHPGILGKLDAPLKPQEVQ
jgi:hypothetical protein